MAYEPPTHTVERSLRATTGAKIVAGVDEVGRGAWAGPVTVCAAVTGLRRPPVGLTDSKLISPKRRTELAARAGGVGHRARPGARLAGGDRRTRDDRRAPARRRPRAGRAAGPSGRGDPRRQARLPRRPWQVRTVIKGDQSCVAVAAASVIAKVRRDAMMAELGRRDYADFGFAANAGYPSPVHRAALEERGPTPLPPALVGLSRRAAPVAAPQEGPRLRGGGRTGKRGPARLRLLNSLRTVALCPPAGASRTGV